MGMVHDAVIVGGSFAGLSAAMMLARARRRVLVLDAGRPRNRYAARSHGVLGHDGRPGRELLSDARAQVLAYPTARLETGEGVSLEGRSGGFVVRLADGGGVEGRRVVLATGVADALPEIPGLLARWGASVLHCPYCHGYEIGGGPIGVLAIGPWSIDHASLIADWGEVVFFTNGTVELDAESRRLLGHRGVAVEPEAVAGIEGEGTEIEGVRLADGRLVRVGALFMRPVTRMASPLAERAGCAIDQTPSAAVIRTDAERLTTVAGVWAAGDATRVMSNITLASADGVTAAMALHRSLVAEG